MVSRRAATSPLTSRPLHKKIVFRASRLTRKAAMLKRRPRSARNACGLLDRRKSGASMPALPRIPNDNRRVLAYLEAWRLLPEERRERRMLAVIRAVRRGRTRTHAAIARLERVAEIFLQLYRS